MKFDDIDYLAYNKLCKKLFKVTYLNIEQNEIQVKNKKDFYHIINNVPENFDKLSNDIVLLPYLGFKDSKDNKFYEGSIFTIADDKGEYFVDQRPNLGHGYRRVGSGDCDFLPQCDFDIAIHKGKTVIIGNIYEHPDLLEKSRLI
jgi:hypothetical protein